MKSIRVQELQRRMEAGEEVFILDVRAASAYDDWHIEQRNVVSANIQNSKLLQFGPEAFIEIPKDKEVITVCAKGAAAKEAVDILEGKGYHAAYLEGGMQAWSEFYYTVQVAHTDDLQLMQVIRPAKGCLSYVLISGEEAVVVDPARHIDVYLDVAKEYGVEIRHILDTHLHADHITGGHDLAAQTGAEYWISASEMNEAKRSYSPLTDGLKIAFGASTLEVMAVPTPGHTPGSTSFLINDEYLLSGDTVFVNGLGRPDLGGKAKEWAHMLYQTVISRLNALSDDMIVLPSHFSNYREVTDDGYVGAVLGQLRSDNQLVLGGTDEESFTEAVSGNTGATPPNYETIVAINRGMLEVSNEEASDLEIGPNRCAVKHLA
ncbi:MBL fold metallo-hydrolase [Alicyclobacillus mengziensis]|uniref:MBL fold metallo-hydrolase n=1 Tax=Alicyclobacillus mengziensis TaxID=2931921 RepID=A0A9X7VWG1_9BACL|nr:MBL fold metallo-hydrolase [Alicyclobacillus mengziensis]QSO46331.1 MBL fold metallo-hydrolase [Alicyclobacillus mengziensis]